MSSQFQHLFDPIIGNIEQKIRDLRCGLIEPESIEDYLENLRSEIRASLDVIEDDFVDDLIAELEVSVDICESESAKEIVDWVYDRE